MFIPEYFDLYGYTISVNSIILMIGSVISLFVFWHETRRDGFDEEKSFDLFIISTLTAALLSRFVYGVIESLPPYELLMHILKFWTSGFNVVGITVGLLLPLFLFPKFWNWSIYRITDIFVVSFSLGMSFVFLGWFLMRGSSRALLGMFTYLVLHITLHKMRLYYRSGLPFSFFIMFNILFGLTFFRDNPYLLFYTVLFTISVVNLYSREKKNPMKSNLSSAFLAKVTSMLQKKEKDLDKEQKNLKKEDPYLQDDRDTDNEYLDDVTEDIQKEAYDLRVKAVSGLARKVKKALGKIKKGTYGICEVCGEPISEERLKAFPEAITCVKHSE